VTGCPKCDGEVAEGAAACKSCGLAVTNFERYAASEVEAPPGLAELWRACEASWDDDEVHELFLRAAASVDGFVYAGRVYRRAARGRGADDERVVKGLERVRRMAEAAWLTRPPATDESAPAGGYRTAATFLIALVLLLGLAAMTLYIVRHVRGGEEPATLEPPPGKSPAPRLAN
jgi:hypothetical protein